VRHESDETLASFRKGVKKNGSAETCNIRQSFIPPLKAWGSRDPGHTVHKVLDNTQERLPDLSKVDLALIHSPDWILLESY